MPPVVSVLQGLWELCLLQEALCLLSLAPTSPPPTTLCPLLGKEEGVAVELCRHRMGDRGGSPAWEGLAVRARDSGIRRAAPR